MFKPSTPCQLSLSPSASHIMYQFSRLICLYLLPTALQAACTSSTCLTCSANSNFCLICKPGFYLQPENVGLCYSYCPTGYSWNAAAKTCDGTPGLVVDYVLNTIAPVIYDKSMSWPAQNGDTASYYYNPSNFEASDPVPSKTRGYHFDGAQYVRVLPLAGQPSVIPVVGTNGSVMVWMMLDVCGSQRTLFGKNDAPPSAANLLLLMIRSSPCNVFSVVNAQFIYGSAVITTNVWHNVLLTFQYNPATGNTDFKLYFDLATDSTLSAAMKMVDDINGQACIGQEYDSGPVKSDFFKGSIWQVTLYNYAISYTTYQAQVLGPGQPASATFTLSTCGVNQYISAGGACVNCLASCTSGCVTGTSCYFCADSMCAYCSSFEAGSCLSCINNAAIVAGACACSDGFYYALASNTCPSCDSSCATCSAAGPSKCTACKSGAQLTAGVNSSCSCSSGYFTVTNAGSCNACDLTCGTCQGAGNLQCSSCKGVAVLSGGSVGSCTCPSAYFPSPDTSNCQPCVSTCLTCQGTAANQCTGCKGAAMISSGSVGTCVCPSAYFPSPDSSNCGSCDVTCLTCQGGNATDCLSCKGMAVRSGGPAGTCACPSTHFPSTNSSNCLNCDSTCLSCQGAGPSQCNSCKNAAAISGGGTVGTCACLSTHFPSSDSSNCQPCDSTCATCQSSGQSQCLSCLGVATLSGSLAGVCVCPSTHFPSPNSSNCQLCNGTCLTCQEVANTQCSSCKTGATISGGGSVGTCVCLSTHFPSPDSSNCVNCDVTCLACQGGNASDCLSCKGVAVRSGGLPGSCACPSTHFPSPNSSNCLICNLTCLSCHGAGPSQCNSCKSAAAISGGGTVGACACLSTHYPSSDSSNCQPCDSTCATCQNSGPSQCLSCLGVATLSSSPGACICPSTHFPSSDSSNCVSCDITCLTCQSSGPSQCTSCLGVAVLVGPVGACLCPSTHYPAPNSSSCQPCHPTCLSCQYSECLSCKGPALLSPSPGLCTCPSTHYGSPDSSNCLPCDFTCGTCSGPGVCDSCLLGAGLVAGMCACLSTHYPAPDPRNCSPCDSTCLSCQSSGPSMCLSCKGIATLQGTTCVCPSNATPSPDSSNCVVCHSACLHCIGSSASDCTACFTHAYLAVPPTSQCICAGGYFPSPSSSSCALCDPTCAACEGQSPLLCTLCKGAAQTTSLPGPCICPAHYYPFSDASMCTSCHIGCEACSNGGEYGCVSCYNGAELKRGTCKCAFGSYPAPDASLCQKCEQSCRECAGPGAAKCTTCREFTELKAGTCLCIAGYHYADDFNCVPNIVLTEYFSGKLISDKTTLTLMFSATLATELQPENITVDLATSLEEIGNFTWRMQPTVPCSRYDILLTSHSAIPTNSTAILSFRNHTAITSTSKAVLSCTSLDTLLVIPKDNSSALPVSTTAAAATHAAVSALMMSAAVSSVVTGSTGALWLLINNLQLLAYIPLSYIPLPPFTRGLLSSTNAFASLPSPFSFLPSSVSGLPQHAQDFGFSSGLFLSNSSQVLASFLALLAWLGAVLLLKRIPYLPVQLYAQSKLKHFKWGYFVRLWIEIYLPLTIAAGLQAYTVLNSAPIDIISAALAGLFAVLLLATPYLFIRKLLFLRKSLKISPSKPSPKANWQVLTEEFAGVDSLSWIYYPLFCLRRLIYAVTQLYLQNSPIIQGITNVGLSGMVRNT